MKARIEEVLSMILSRKYDAKITIKFVDKEGEDGDYNKTYPSKEKQVLG